MDVIDCFFLEQLLRAGESEYVDFKQEYYSKEKKADFLHDILCMANANSPNDRYIVFGVSDDKQVVGLTDDMSSIVNKFHNIIDWLRGVHLNRDLYNHISVHPVHYNEKNVIMLRVENTPLKPFFLTKDYKYGACTVRAGAVYTRNRDSNTPINSTASDDEISLMYEERLGLDKTHLEKASEFLKDYDNWEYEGATDSYYYNKHPEYKIKNKKSDERNRDDVAYDSKCILETFEPYLSRYLTEIDPNKISREVYYLEYDGTRIGIESIVISGLDNGRRLIPYPCFEPDGKCDIIEYYIKDNYELDICQVIQRHCFWNKGSPRDCSVNDYDVKSTITRFTKFHVK